MNESIFINGRQLIQHQGCVFLGYLNPANSFDALIDNQAVAFLLGDGQCLFVHQVKERVGGGDVLPPVHHAFQLRKLSAVVAVGLFEVTGFADAVYLREVGGYI